MRHYTRMHRRGAIFITALGITVVLSSLVLVFAMNMRTESLAAVNRMDAAKAGAIELGAERWVMAQIESSGNDAMTITQTPAEAMGLGDGYFWIIRPDADSDQNYVYGIADESAKLNLNVATSDQLLQLPGMTDELCDAIRDWVDEDSTTSSFGAESDFYASLPEPYLAKNGPMESVEELLLVKNFTPDLLWGYDRNRDGVIDDTERTVGGASTMYNSATADARGLFPFVTVYTVQSNTAANGDARVNVNNRDVTQLQNVLRNAFDPSRADAILTPVLSAILATRRGNTFNTLGDFYTISTMKNDEFAKVVDKLTVTNTKTLTGLVNVNTAPKQVLRCLPGLEEADADALIAKRPASSDNIAWVFDALTPAKAGLISSTITARSSQYSADIVAVSGDGRAYQRVKVVVDARSTPKIIYRKDLSSLGWPLPQEIRDSLRAGKGVVATGTLNFGSMR